MLGKLKPIVAVEGTGIEKQLGVQEPPKAAPKSEDPVNFPVWEIPVNKKVLIYVPNHVVVDSKGVESLRMDMPLIHPVTDGKRFYNYRCINGLEDESLGFNGSCPLCDGTAEPWELANLQINEKCKAQGLDPDDSDNASVKSIRSDAFNDRAVKDTVRYFTFPIVVFETENDDAKNIVKDENGIKYQVYWYSISETMYQDKWQKTLDAMEDEPTHPGGRFFVLDYTYTPKKGEPNKRDSARALSVNPRNIKGGEPIKKVLDAQTEGWTPVQAINTVINNHLYSYDQLVQVADEALENTRNLLIMYKNPGKSIEKANEELYKLDKKPEVPADGADDGSIALDDVDEE